MKSESEDGCDGDLAENFLSAVSLGLESNERSVVCRRLRGPDRAAVPRPGQRQVDDELSSWFGTSLQDYLERRCDTIEDALGLRPPQGGVPWWMEIAIRTRDAALRELADSFHAERSVAGRAQEIHLRALRYAASAWRFDREREVMPERYKGTQTECLWQAFKSGAAMPIGVRQLRNILGP